MNKEELITYLEGMEAVIITLGKIDVGGALRIIGEVIAVVELELDVEDINILKDLGVAPWDSVKIPDWKAWKIPEGPTELCAPSLWSVKELNYGDFKVDYKI